MVQVRALGPVEAWMGQEAVPLGGPKQRTVLALLIAAAGRPAPVDGLIDGLWGDRADAGAKGTLQTYVSTLRRTLGSDVVVRDGDAYRLALGRSDVDVWRFEDTVDAARALLSSAPSRAVEQLDEALRLWQGRPYTGVAASRPLEIEVRRLEELRLDAIEDRIEAQLALGGGGQLASELEALTREHPMRERLRGHHMLSLYRAGRQADALRVYDETRTYLLEELGVDPSPQLQALYRRVLEQDRRLDGAQPRAIPSSAVEPPSGIVTFVCTDIEGSTHLHHHLGAGFVGVLDRHREILRRVWEAYQGYEFSADGGSFRVAFADPVAAVDACVEGQQALAAASWPAGIDVRVRMGVHSGLASPHARGYVALAVDEAAGVMAAGHGGQIIASERTAGLLEQRPGRRLHALGRYRLSGFQEPVRLYQLTGEGIETGFASLRAVPADGHNLVRPPTEIVDREDLLEGVATAIAPGRLVTLTGPGGVGKTRLATEVGMDIAPTWEDGVWMVDLAPVSDPRLVGSAIADTLGAPSRVGGDRFDDARDHLADRRAVLILDNCEHVVVGCAQLIGPLLSSCPGVGVLATSREPLRWPGEHVWSVDPLPVPDEAVDPSAVLATPAAQLFVERGTSVRRGFAVDQGNAQAVAVLCRQLDGLPLLLELAAAHLSAQSPSEILAGLRERPMMLRSSDVLVPDRHRTTDGLLEWSYELLREDERAAFRRLSVFKASFSLDSATVAVASGGVDPADVPPLVWSLVGRSLVSADLTASATRYRLLETVRSYGRRLLEEPEADAVATNLAGWLLDRIGPWQPDDRRWVSEVAVEIGNLRGLLPLLPDDQHERAQAIACTIGRYHDVRQSFREGIGELSPYADALDAPSTTRVALLTTLAYLHLRTGEITLAERLGRSAADVREVHGAPEWDDAGVERIHGDIALRSGDVAGAAAIARSALTRDLGDRGRARMYNLLGIALSGQGDDAAAYAAFAEELELQQASGHEGYVASAHGNLAEAALRLGDVPTAARHQRQCLERAVAQGSPAMVAFSLMVAGRVAGLQGAWETAVRVQARAEVLLEEIGLRLYDDDRREIEQLRNAARRELGTAQFERMVQAGRDMDVAAALELSDGILGDAEPDATVGA